METTRQAQLKLLARWIEAGKTQSIRAVLVLWDNSGELDRLRELNPWLVAAAERA